MSEGEIKAVEELQRIMAEMIMLFKEELAEKNQALVEAEKNLSYQRWLTMEANEYIQQLEQRGSGELSPQRN